MSVAKRIGYLAVDDGPKATLAPLAALLPGLMLDDHEGSERSRVLALESRCVDLLVCGTSDSRPGRDIERAARIAATDLGIPHVLVEDFPGNYTRVVGAREALLVVDGEFASDLAHRQHDSAGPPTIVVPSIRYDSLRARLAALRENAKSQHDLVLWAGQPETDDSLRCLSEVMPYLSARGIRLIFRAHPRDAGHRNGAYGRLFARAGSHIEEASAVSLEACLQRRPRLVITQYSSLAVEAGFWGIPSLHLLYEDVGAARLFAKKRYYEPPWIAAGAAFIASAPGTTESQLERALSDEAARELALKRFDDYFQVTRPGAPILIDFLYNQHLL